MGQMGLTGLVNNLFFRNTNTQEEISDSRRDFLRYSGYTTMFLMSNYLFGCAPGSSGGVGDGEDEEDPPIVIPDIEEVIIYNNGVISADFKSSDSIDVEITPEETALLASILGDENTPREEKSIDIETALPCPCKEPISYYSSIRIYLC